MKHNMYLLTCLFLIMQAYLIRSNNSTTWINIALIGNDIIPGQQYGGYNPDISDTTGNHRKTILAEFDKSHKPGQWEIHQYSGQFVYYVSRKKLIMEDTQGQNQHLTRKGVLINPNRPYAIELDFIIDEPGDAPVPNSFCINFNIAGEDGQLDSIYCWSMNLDVAPTGVHPAGVMKTMGFVNGGFNQIKPTHKIDWCELRTAYHMILRINKNLQDKYVQDFVSVMVYEGHKLKDSFETDYSKFPYQVDYNKPVRFGLNTHGANWIVKNLKVYYLD